MNGHESPVARLDNVTHRYGATYALDAVTLAIPSGCMVGLIGPDGVGKSSLLGLIAGARRIQTGRVRVLDGDMANSRHRGSVCARIAYMPQGLGRNLYPDLSVRENIEFFGRLFGQLTRRARAADRRTARQHWPCDVRGPAGQQALRRHAAEARAVLRPDPRSRPADPGRADDRRRSAVAAAVLAI